LEYEDDYRYPPYASNHPSHHRPDVAASQSPVQEADVQRHNHNNSSSSTSSNSSSDHANTTLGDRHSDLPPRTQPTRPPQDQPNPPAAATRFPVVDDELDDSMSLMNRVSLHVGRAMAWYQSQTDTVQSLLKVLVIMTCLYVAFGGRFGLEYMLNPKKNTTGGGGGGSKFDDYYPKQQQQQYQRGNYEAGNAYDEYYTSRRRQDSPSPQQRPQDHRQQQQQQQQYDRYSSSYDHKDDYRQSRRKGSSSSSSSSSFHFPNLFDGSFQSMTILAGVAYFCHRNGINPMQALMMMNLMAGGRARGFRRGFGGGGGLGGMFGRRPGGMRYGGRPGGRWF
jgi:hypothetical protein